MKTFAVCARNIRGTTRELGTMRAASLEAALHAWTEAWLRSYGTQYAPKVEEVVPRAYCGTITLHTTQIVIYERAASDHEYMAACALPLPAPSAETT